MAFETLVAHDFTHHLLNVSHQRGKVLALSVSPVPAIHTHVKALDEPLLDGVEQEYYQIKVLNKDITK